MMKKILVILCVIPVMSYAQLGCGDTFTDSGGAGGSYSDGENTTYTVCPDNPGDFARVVFSSFDTESGYDYLTVYDGSVAGVNQIGSFTGLQNIGPFQSTTSDGCLTFVFTSDGSVTNSGWVATVSCIINTPTTSDLVNVRSYNGDVVTAYDYTLIPNSQRTAMTFGAKVANSSTSAQSNKTMSVVLNDGSSNVYTGSTTFNIAALDTQYVWVNSGFTPQANKTYTLTVTLGSDDDNSNNSKVVTFQTQNDYYAHDLSSTTVLGASAVGTDYYFTNNYFMHGSGTIYSIDVKLAPGTTPNQTIRAFVSSDNGFITDGTKLITASDIANGQFTKIYLNTPISVSNTGTGLTYYTGVGSENLTGTINLYTNLNNNDDNATGILSNGSFTVSDRTYSTRVNFSQGCAGFAFNNTVTAAQSCNPSSGKINLTVTTGGTALPNQNNVSWTGSSSGTLSNQSNNFSINNLPQGTYSVTVTNNGCSTTVSNITIGTIPSPTISLSQTAQISCFGNNDASVSFTTNGNTTGYSFAWDNGSTASSLSNLGAGTYTVSGSNGVCTITESITVENPADIIINATKTNVSVCGGTNGSIQLNVTGGTSSSYLYTWTGPVTGSSGAGFGGSFSINNLSAGNYIITVTNDNCVKTATVSISESGATVVTINNLSPVSCSGASDGDLKVISSFNISSYTFTWSTGATGINLNNVPAGTYSVVGTNGNCTTTANFVLIDPMPLNVNGFTGVSTITTSVIGGTGNMSFAWTGPGGFTSSSQNLTGLTALGTYTVTVTDQHFCTSTKTFVLNFLGEDELIKEVKIYKFYPNPSSSTINFEVNDQISSINIFDYSGKFIQTLNVKSEVEILNLDSYVGGVYFFNLVSNDHEVVFRNKFTVVK